jgi:hypothetical protein
MENPEIYEISRKYLGNIGWRIPKIEAIVKNHGLKKSEFPIEGKPSVAN